MSKKAVALSFALLLAASAPVFAQGRGDDSVVHPRSPAARFLEVVKRVVVAFEQAIEITVPHP